MVNTQFQTASSHVPWPNFSEFSNVWESPYNTVNKSAFQCQKDRGTGDVSTSMFLINHFLDTELLGNPVPDVADANVTNAASGPGSLGEEVAICAGLYNRYPNFLLVDVRPLPIWRVTLLTEAIVSFTNMVEAQCFKLLRLPTVLPTLGLQRLQNPRPARARADRSPLQTPRHPTLEVGTQVAG
jgi:hypothetical protein